VTVKVLDFNPPPSRPPAPLPLSERVLDRLCDILYASDEILDMLKVERAADPPMQEVESAVRKVFDDINRLMMRIAD
jgi:hypothetical protein